MIGIFPCRQCLLLACCTEDCEKITKKNDDVKIKELEYGVCPHCGYGVVKGQHLHTVNEQMWNCYRCNNCQNSFSYTTKILITQKLIDGVFQPVEIVNGI